MKIAKKMSIVSGLACLVLMPFSASATSPSSQVNNNLQLAQSIVNPGGTLKNTLAYSRCIRWVRRCTRVRKCSRYYHRGGRYGRCYVCYRPRYSSYYGRRYYKYYKTCSYNRMRNLYYRGYRCTSRYYGRSRSCARWYWRSYCRNYCVKRVYY